MYIHETLVSYGIAIIYMSRDTPIPQHLNRFWASEENKRNLQLLIMDIVCNELCANPIIKSSVVSDNEALPAIKYGNKEIPELFNWIGEADARVVAHVAWAARIKQCKRVVVLSNDTDSFALLLHFTPLFQTLGLKEIWQQYVTGEKRRIHPLQQEITWFGTPLAFFLYKRSHIDRRRLHEYIWEISMQLWPMTWKGF